MKATDFLFLILTGSIFNSEAQNIWTQKTDFGGTARRGAAGFSIGDKGYLGTGNDGTSEGGKDFWEYDPVSDAWTQKADLAGEARQFAVGLSMGNYGYIGTGKGANNNLNDFWQYDPIGNTWVQKASFTGGKRYWATGFSIEDKGYLGTGYNDGLGLKKDFWEYDPAINTWTQKANLEGPGRERAVGFSIDDKGYISCGLGLDGVIHDLWEYDPATNTWTEKADFPGLGVNQPVAFSISGKGYVGTGSDGGTSVYPNEFWQYDPLTDTWAEKATFPGTGRFEAVGFAIGGKGYIGTGEQNYPSFLKDFWEYTPDCTTPTGLSTTNITNSKATLNWNGVSGAVKYNVRYKVMGNNPWITVSSLSTSKMISGLTGGTTYTWQVKSVCSTTPHITSAWSAKQNFTTSLRLAPSDESNNLEVYPNPFSSMATISFSLEENSHITIDLFDLAGRKLKTLLDENLEAGDHIVQLNGEQMVSGIYLLQIEEDDQSSAVKIIVE